MKHFFSKTLFLLTLSSLFIFSCKPGGSGSSKFASSSASRETYSHYLDDSSFLADDDFGRDFVVERESFFHLYTFNESKGTWYRVVVQKKSEGSEYNISLLSSEEVGSSNDYFSLFDTFHEGIDEEFRFSRGALRSGLNTARLCDEQTRGGICALGVSSDKTLRVNQVEGDSLVFNFLSLEKESDSLKNHEVFLIESKISGESYRLCSDFSEGSLRFQKGDCSSRFKLVLQNYTSCGDGLVQRDEECDDNNRVSRDGCDNLCYAEPDPLDCNREDKEKNVWDNCGQCVAEGKEKDCHDNSLSDAEVALNEKVVFSNRSQKLFVYNKEKDSWHQVTVKEVGGEFLFDFLEESSEEKNFHIFDFYTEGKEKELKFKDGVIQTSINVTDLCDGSDFEKVCSLSVSSSGDASFVNIGKLENKGKTFSLRSFGSYNGKLTYYDPFFIAYEKDGVPHTLCADFSAEAFSLDPVPEYEEDGCRTPFKIYYSDYTSCGDEVVQHDETCDDGNRDTEKECPYGTKNCSYCSADCSESLSLTGRLCGDGTKDEEEACDDGNLTDETSCAYGTASCSFCSGDCLSVLSLTGPVCGDGTADAEEECDDGNTKTESSCPYGSATCTLCASDCQEELALRGSYCGDGTTDTDYETCDDNNTTTETACPYGETSCTYCNSDCSEVLASEDGDLKTSYCGDGVEDSSNSESCDDGNTASGDGCESCSIVSGYTCDQDSNVYCSVCGDGVLGGGEACDDGDTVTEDNCDYGTPSCILCNADCSLAIDRTGSYCGDGTEDLANGEKCDDGGNDTGDGCDASCLIETGYTCDSSASLYCSVCGDGDVGGGEVCDDGGTVAETNCLYNETSCEYCNADCSAVLSSANGDLAVSYCGDNTIDSSNSETCEDGNKDSGDGCSDTCQVEEGYTCCEDGYLVSSLETSTEVAALAGALEPQIEVRCPADTIVMNYSLDYSSDEGVTGLQLKCKKYPRSVGSFGDLVETIGSTTASESSNCADQKIVTGFQFYTDENKTLFTGMKRSCLWFADVARSASSTIAWNSLVGDASTHSSKLLCETGSTVTGFKYSEDSNGHIQSISLLCEEIKKISCDNEEDSYCSTCGDGEVGGLEPCDPNAEGMAIACTEYDTNCAACKDDCSAYFLLEGPHCGDGIADANNSEGCDDGNLDSGDGCSECAVETGWDCSSGTCCLLNNFYADTDGDGAGDPDNLKQSCESSLSGYVLDDTSDECPTDGDVVQVATSDTDCNGVDDDCNGTADDGYVAVATSCGVGACASTGARECLDGLVLDSCDEGTAASSDTDCDGIDDDCNGTADDGYVATSTSCGVGACAATGTLSCVSGSEVDSCSAGTAASSDATCDGVDDDCNGTADDGYVSSATDCGVGACAATGTLSCVSGSEVDSCSAGTAASSDTDCDGVDDDCNGTVDDGYVAVATSCGVGACAATGTLSCVSGSEVDSCSEGTAASSDTDCDGVDDDCNGTVDDGYVATATSCGVGACAATGTLSCVSGSEVDSCSEGAAASSDADCDGVDDDCDGNADEDYVSSATSCGEGACAATGTLSCVSGSEVDSCSAGTAASSDTDCDGVDDDCNGTVDDGYVATATSCGVGACASTGTLSCVSGSEVDSCSEGTAASSDADCDGVDDDCDGNTDEDVGSAYGTAYYLDTDGDGYGAGNVKYFCDDPGSGYATNNTDECPDDANLTSKIKWYKDNDGDGTGNLNFSTFACAATSYSGYSRTTHDYCDNNAEITTKITWYLDNDGDGYGDPSNSKSTCNSSETGYVQDSSDSCDDFYGQCICGNGIVERNEECDDENDTDSDGCTDCTIDSGYNCCEEGYLIASEEKILDVQRVDYEEDVSQVVRCPSGYVATGIKQAHRFSRFALNCSKLNLDESLDTSNQVEVGNHVSPMSRYIADTYTECDSNQVMVGATVSVMTEAYTGDTSNFSNFDPATLKVSRVALHCVDSDKVRSTSQTVTNVPEGPVLEGLYEETSAASSTEFCGKEYAVTGFWYEEFGTGDDEADIVALRFICEKIQARDCSARDSYCDTCGNGEVGGEELCDNGTSNKDTTRCNAYDSTCGVYCSIDCMTSYSVIGPYCGDNIFQVSDEVCEGQAWCEDDCSIKSTYDCCEDGYNINTSESRTEVAGVQKDLNKVVRCPDDSVATGVQLISTNSVSGLGLTCSPLSDLSSTSTSTVGSGSMFYTKKDCDEGEILVNLSLNWLRDGLATVTGGCVKLADIPSGYSSTQVTTTGELAHLRSSDDAIHTSELSCEGADEVITGFHYGKNVAKLTILQAICRKLDYVDACDATDSDYCSSCGDGSVGGPEACDVNDTALVASGDDCTGSDAECESCSSDCGESYLHLGPSCGDGIVQTGEKCDGVYGCNSSCSNKSGFQCDPETNECGLCGDGLVEGGEACDDGNTTTEEECPYEAFGTGTCTACNKVCSAVLSLIGGYCGDSIAQDEAGESCDGDAGCNDSICRLANEWGQVESSWTNPQVFHTGMDVYSSDVVAVAEEGNTMAFLSRYGGDSMVTIKHYTAESGWKKKGGAISFRNGEYRGNTTSIGRGLALNEDGTMLVVRFEGSDDTGIIDTFFYDADNKKWENVLNSDGTPYGLSESEPNSSFGESFSLSDDGSEMIVGASNGADSQGRASYYKFNTTTQRWNLQFSITGEASGDAFGNSVALYSDGNNNKTYLVVGAPYYDTSSTTDVGQVKVYTVSHSSPTTYSLDKTHTGTVANGLLGYSVSIARGDSSKRYAYGAPGEQSGKGVAYVKTYGGTSSYTVTGSAADTGFAKNVRLGNKGDLLGVGAPQYNPGSKVDAGRVTFYGFSSGSYAKKGSSITGTVTQAKVGKSFGVSMYSETTVIAESYQITSTGSNWIYPGGVWVYRYYDSEDTSY